MKKNQMLNNQGICDFVDVVDLILSFKLLALDFD